MRRAAAVLIALAAPVACFADGRADAFNAMLPEPAPPVDFVGTQYVDTRGCIFAQVDHGGHLIWAPLFRDGQQSCGPQAMPQEVCVIPEQAGRYAQVGAFTEPANAEAARVRIEEMGLTAVVRSSGRRQVVLAGPFGSWRLARESLGKLRCSGFADAFGVNRPPR